MRSFAIIAAAVLVTAAAWTVLSAGERGRLSMSELQRNRSLGLQAHGAIARVAALALPDAATNPQEVRAVVHRCREADDSAVAALREAALRAPDPLVAGNAIRALGRLHAVASPPDLLGLLDDPRQRVRQEMIRALGRGGGPDAVGILLDCVASVADEERPLVLAALGELGDHRARDDVARIAADPTRPLIERVFARTALARLEPRRTRR